MICVTTVPAEKQRQDVKKGYFHQPPNPQASSRKSNKFVRTGFTHTGKGLRCERREGLVWFGLVQFSSSPLFMRTRRQMCSMY
jgi:hypothetical protein